MKIYLEFFIPQNLGDKDFGIYPNLLENYIRKARPSQTPKPSESTAHPVWLPASRRGTLNWAGGRRGHSE